jgi:peptide-methionine (S)-S-oxide reductase
MLFGSKKDQMVGADDALPGRDEALWTPPEHFVKGTSLTPPFPEGSETLVVGMGCFWGSEELYWQAPGVITTAVGYAGGFTPNPTYEEVCSGRTGHTEVALVVFDPEVTSLEAMLKIFWENHDPTLGMRQGNDVGTQYRSAVFTSSDEQLAAVEASRDRFQKVLDDAGIGEITTEIGPLDHFWYAEDHHQQYLAKVPHGYRCHAKTGLELPAA